MSKKDKEQTRQRLIDAAGNILQEHGFQGLGVNAIAREAGVDKVLIYRYFGNLDGLLLAFMAQRDYFSNLDAMIGDVRAIATKSEALEVGKRILLGQLRQILHNKELQEMLLWELEQNNPVTARVAEQREQQGRAALDLMQEITQAGDIDFPACISILIGGIYYLALRARTADVYNGIDLTDEAGWQRIECALTQLLELITESL